MASEPTEADGCQWLILDSLKGELKRRKRGENHCFRYFIFLEIFQFCLAITCVVMASQNFALPTHLGEMIGSR